MDKQQTPPSTGVDRPPRERDRKPKGAVQDYPAERARGARIVLNTPARRFVFFGGLILFVVFAILMAIAVRLSGPA